MPTTQSRVIVIGASAGGIEALIGLVASLPPDLGVPIFLVQHLPADYVSTLPAILSRKGPVPAEFARDGAVFEPDRIYVAPPDHHLLVQPDRMLVKKGPKENRFRPSVDALFRSAAFTFGARTIGIVLSGALDDGTSGLWSIKCLGGTTMVQDPSEAAYQSMPDSALQQVEVDYCLAVRDMGQALHRLTREAIMEKPAYVDDVEDVDDDRARMEMEMGVARGDDSFKKGILNAGPMTAFTCPECHGVLVRIKEGKITRFRCHTGHGYSSNALLSAAMERVEEHYGKTMASLEETAMLFEHMGKQLAESGNEKTAALFFEQAQSAIAQSEQLREVLQARENFSAQGLLRRAKES